MFESDTYRTKCWKIYFKIEKLIGGSLFNRPRSANKRQLRSVFTSIFRFDGAPFRDRIDAETGPMNLAEFLIFNWFLYEKFHYIYIMIIANLLFLLAPSLHPFQIEVVNALRRNLLMQWPLHLQEYQELQCQHLVL